MGPLTSFMDENNLHHINWDAKVDEFIDQHGNECDLSCISSLLPSNVISDIKTIPIPSTSLEHWLFGVRLKMGNLLLNQQLGE